MGSACRLGGAAGLLWVATLFVAAPGIAQGGGVRVVADELVVRTAQHSAVLEAQLRNIGASISQHREGSRLLLLSLDRRHSGGGRIISARVQENTLQGCAALISNRVVEACEPNYIYRALATPNDPRYSEQTGLARIEAPQAWDISIGSEQVVVAVLDSGVDYTHPDLSANIWQNSGEIAGNLKDDDNNGYVDDVRGWDFIAGNNDPQDIFGHGTYVAGIIGAVGNNGVGIAGVAWRVKILPVRVLDEIGDGTLYQVASGVEYAARFADIINLSLGGSSTTTVLEQAIAEAVNSGTLVVTAAGNYGRNNDIYPTYPANYNLSGLITVAATDLTDRLASFSNYSSSKVHVAAPGVSILGTYPGATYHLDSGTSASAPYVAGIAALIKSVRPSITGSEMRYVLEQTVDKSSYLTGYVASGGRVNARKALQFLGTPEPTATPGGEPTETATPTPQIDEQLNMREINRRLTRSRPRARLRGRIRDEWGNALLNRAVLIICAEGTIVRERVSGLRGSFFARVPRPKIMEEPMICYSESRVGRSSNEVSINSRKRRL